MLSVQVCVCVTGPDTQEMLDSHDIKDMLDGTVPFSWTAFSSRVSFIPVFHELKPARPILPIRPSLYLWGRYAAQMFYCF